MDFLKVKKFRKAHKPDPEKDMENINDSGGGCGGGGGGSDGGGDNDVKKSSKVDNGVEVEDDDDDDFITNEVKRRLKELRKNSFMVLIPEEEEEELYTEDDGEEAGGETCSSEWRDVEAEGRQWWGGFDAVYEKYCERMLFYDKMIAQQLKEAGSSNPSTPSPKSENKKLRSPLSCLFLKKIEEPDEEAEQLQQSINNPYQDLETAYVAQFCLTWEALHCQYSQLSQIVLCQPENPICYNHSAQQLQQFQVLLQRFIENEPFQDGPRSEIYARARNILPKLLQIPNIQGSDWKEKVEEESDYSVLAPDIIQIIESTILVFRLFLKMDNKKHGSFRNLFGNQNPMATPLQQVQSLLEKVHFYLNFLCYLCYLIWMYQIRVWVYLVIFIYYITIALLFATCISHLALFGHVCVLLSACFVLKDKQSYSEKHVLINLNLGPLLDVQQLFFFCHFYLQKGAKLKELCKKRKGWKKNTWPISHEDVPLLFGLIDIKIISRVLRMGRISKEELFWCEEKVKKLHFCDGKLERDPSPILFPVLMKG
ncbi:hypothetical protein Goklo_003366 [Gossypium klotzschianum]|uniref:Uncharacterized protein n=1 Tax=Gossypium klotzschianum TaxID=34286 RepID=A0A7J8VKV7_9ROSI|nr:hypothetical protein [Gossypium klotzschianum]